MAESKFYSLTVYGAMVGHVFSGPSAWNDAICHAADISRVTGVWCGPGYDGTHQHGEDVVVVFDVRVMNPKTFARFRNICAEQGWPITVTGYPRQNSPEVLDDAEIEYLLEEMHRVERLPSDWHVIAWAALALVRGRGSWCNLRTALRDAGLL